MRGPRATSGPLVWLMMPFVAGYLSARWLVRASVHGLGRALGALADASVAVGRGLADAARAVGHATADVLRAVGHVLAELGRRLVVVLKAIAHQVARPIRAMGHLLAQLGRRIAAVLRAAGHATADVLRAVGHVLAELGRRLVVVLKAIAHQVARPIRAVGRLLAQLGRRTAAVLRAVGHATADLLRATGHVLAQLGRRIAAVLRVAAHAFADVLRAVGHVLAEGFRLARRTLVRLLVALRPVAFVTGRTAGRLFARALVVFLVGVLAVRVGFRLAGVSLRVMIVVTAHALRSVTRAITLVLGPPFRLAARGLVAAFRVVAATTRRVASALAAAVSRAVGFIARTSRLVMDGLIAPAVRAARTMLLVFVVAFVVAGRAARRILGSALSVIRPPVVAAARALAGATRALSAAISGAARSLRRSLSDARQRLRVALSGAADSIRVAIRGARDGMQRLLGRSPTNTGSGRRRIRP